MSRPIKAGDKVTVTWAVEHVPFKGIVLSMPSGVGDLLYIEDEQGTIHGINTCSSEFERIIKRPVATS